MSTPLPRPASRLRPRLRHGRGFELSGRYQLDDPSWTLVHGSIQAKVIAEGAEIVRFPHAWLKRDGWIYDSVLNKTYKESRYIAIYAARELTTYQRQDAGRMVMAAGHWGPWVERDSLTVAH